MIVHNNILLLNAREKARELGINYSYFSRLVNKGTISERNIIKITKKGRISKFYRALQIEDCKHPKVHSVFHPNHEFILCNWCGKEIIQ